ncbi:RNA polymerase sigma factor [Desertimonas flava]|uniref:RNA polymerase sigma factor n=1 Tax=Desertimonas flava TaxID=2064846 RepID=UPI0013C50B0F|nr:sigma-70 family RNA polymerase sigma factor [Desertimonas flava]
MTFDARQRFDAIFRAHYAAVRRYAHHRSIVGSDADDLVSETFLVAWRRLDVVPADALPWLLAVAANVQRNQARTRRRHRSLLERVPRPEPVAPPAEPGLGSSRIRSALDRLSAADREILILVAWDDLTAQQLAVVLGTTAGTARLRLHRARRRFAGQLEADEPAAVMSMVALLDERAGLAT